MAYIHGEARAAGSDWKGATGHADLYWHRMPPARVESLDTDDSRGGVEIRWKVPDYEGGVSACLSFEEARALAEELLNRIGEASETIDNDVDDTAAVNDDGTTAASKEVA